MTKTNLILLGIFALFCNSYNSYAYNPPDSLGLRITKFEVSGSYDLGDTVVIVSEYETDLPVKIEAGLDFSEFLTPVGFTGSTYNTSSTMTIDTATTYTDTTYMVVQDEGVTHLSFTVRTSDEDTLQDIPNFHDRSSSFTSVETGPEGQVIQETLNDSDEQLLFFEEEISSLGSVGIHDFSYSGKIVYKDVFGGKYPSPLRGVPCAKVRLWFTNSELVYQQQKLIHPVPLVNNEYIEGVHYCITDEEGNFSFNFNNITGFTDKDWTVNFSVEKKNDYLDLYSFTDHVKVNMVDNQTMRFFIRVHGDNGLEIDKTCSTHVNNNMQIEINKYDGQIFRYITLSGMFIKARLCGNRNAPFSALPFPWDADPVRVDLKNSGTGNTSYYHPGNKSIEIINRFKSGLICHEYGHYVHDLMSRAFNGTTIYNSNNNYTEGFAEFYQFAVRNWIQAVFGDQIVDFKRNTEMGPFLYGHDIGKQTSERFYLIYPGGNVTQKGIACFFWQIYDSYTEEDFLADEYQGKENDDVSGFGEIFFNTIVSYPVLGNTTLMHIKNNYDPSLGNSELRTSIQRIWDCNLAGDVINPPKMRSAQVGPDTDGEITNPSEYTLNIVRRNYGTGSMSGGGYLHYEDKWSYISCNYMNLPYGYRLYTRDTEFDSWDYFSTYAYDIDNDYIIFCGDDLDCPANGTMQVKLTAYDGNAGDSYGAPWFWSTEPEGMSISDNQLSDNSQLEIIPNPVTSISNIDIRTNENLYMSVSVFDYQSRLVKEIGCGNFGPGLQSFTFYKSGLSSGIYYVVVKTIDSKGTNNIMTKQIVII